jgi:hypothetical protein
MASPDLRELAAAVLSQRDYARAAALPHCPTVPSPSSGTAGHLPTNGGNLRVLGVPPIAPADSEAGHLEMALSRPVSLSVPLPGQAGTRANNLPLEAADHAALAAAVEARARALAGIFADSDVRADHAAIMADTWPNGPPPRTEPPADLVQRLAVALAAPRPWQRMTDPEKALAYFRAQGRRRLAPLDPLARWLLVQAEEAEARRWRVGSRVFGCCLSTVQPRSAAALLNRENFDAAV